MIMVFRKPYGFLIKHFKLIHLLITAILIYLVSCNNDIYSYVNSCVIDGVNRYNALEYINYGIFFFIAIAIFLFFVIYWLFKYKDKPKRLYVISMCGYTVVGIFMFVLFMYLRELPNNVINQKVIRGYRDIMLLTLGYQYIIIVIMFIRGLGFDIKKFNFGKDIQELNLTEEDGEEVEVDVSIDTTNVMREVRKRKREFGYYLNEYKIFIIGIFAIIFGIFGIKGFNYLKDVLKVYEQGVTVGNINYLTVNSGYLNVDDDNNKYIIVGFDISKYGKKERLNVANMVLKINGVEYIPNRNICYKFNKLGNCYKKQYITDNKSSYILVYKVDDLNLKRTYLVYNESYENRFKIKLNLENYE